MDVGFYLGELLMQQGEVSVPGLGYFAQVRISGYYDETERKFYPPYHQAQFDVQSIDDDSLAEYIANKKNISVASARYFAEKYITNLKQQAAISEVQIGNLGWFYTELSQLTFRAADKIIDDTIFFGFDPISISKISDIKREVVEKPKVELKYPERLKERPPLPQPTPEVVPNAVESLVGTYETPLPGKPIEEEPEQHVTHQPTEPQSISSFEPDGAGVSPEFFEPVDEEEEEQEENRGPLRLILVILVAIVFLGMGVFALYRYQPDTFAKIAFWKKAGKNTEDVKPSEVIPSNIDTPGIDTTFIDTTNANKIDTIDARPAATTTTEVITQPTATPPVTTAAPSKQTVVAATPAPVKTEAAKPAVTKPAATEKVVVEKADATKKEAEIPKSESTRVRMSSASGTHRFEVYVSPACKDMAEAKRLITKLANKGLDARVVDDAAGPLLHVSIGNFKTAKEAKAYAIKVQESGKVTGDAYPQEIIPPTQ